MTDRYALEFQQTEQMMRAASEAWGNPQISWGRRGLKMAGFILGGGAIGAAISYFGLLDDVPDGAVTGAVLGFFAGLILWWCVFQRDLHRMGRLTTDLLARIGKTRMEITAAGIDTRDDLGQHTQSWRAYDKVIAMKGGTALQSGAMMYPIPHAALPPDTNPQTFHADLIRWHAEATR